MDIYMDMCMDACMDLHIDIHTHMSVCVCSTHCHAHVCIHTHMVVYCIAIQMFLYMLVHNFPYKCSYDACGTYPCTCLHMFICMSILMSVLAACAECGLHQAKGSAQLHCQIADRKIAEHDDPLVH